MWDWGFLGLPEMHTLLGIRNWLLWSPSTVFLGDAVSSHKVQVLLLGLWVLVALSSSAAVCADGAGCCISQLQNAGRSGD
jgi:hypothetical protein